MITSALTRAAEGEREQMSNLNQEPEPETLTMSQALRLIAERTAFRTEQESTMVLAVIDAQIAADAAADAAYAKLNAVIAAEEDRIAATT